MYRLKNRETGEEIGLIDENQLQFLINELEEENINDKDYWLHRSQLLVFKEKGADIKLLDMLERAFGSVEELEIFWENF